MQKRLFAGVLLMSLALVFFAGCGKKAKSEKERIKDATVEVSCQVMKEMETLMTAALGAMGDESAAAELETKGKALEAKMEEIVKKHGFESSDQLKEIGKKYEADKAFEDEVKKAVKDKCGFDLDAAGA